MPRTKRPPKDVLAKLVKDMTDVRIGELYGTSANTVRKWRRRYDLKSDGSYWPQEQCTNCCEHVSGFLVHGLCKACYWFWREHGRNSTAADRRMRGGASGWCRRCKESPARSQGLCAACWSYQYNNGKPRPKYLIERVQCKVCGKPWAKGFAKGRCTSCRAYLDRHGIERPRHLWEHIRWCDDPECGNRATHLDVELCFNRSEGKVVTGKYNLCDRCMALEQS